MSNWTSITVDNLKAAGFGFVVDKARAASTGGIDPAVQEIAGAVARVRRAVSAGNTMDADTTKVPASLQDVTVRMAYYNLVMRLRVPLTTDEADKQRSDNSDLLRIADDKVKVEEPDTPGGSAEMQHGNTVEALGVPRRKTKREALRGL